ncbi:MAG: nucleotidyl transferase AbiEii/AbiGii toxin family protein [Candidatus Omnitrophica bacterium]|nr:nucleotidyl transferase AbiEii/AbiGii toxin family protein [Candidatus Omnitrophota bacterium]
MATFNIQEMVECFQLLFLLFLSHKIDRKHYILKGDCNLRFFFKSPRCPEGIDFDLQNIPVPKFREQVNRILRSSVFIEALSIKGLIAGYITESKQTETTQRWKLHLRSRQMQTYIPTRIEFSRRDAGKIESKFEAVDSCLLKKYELPPVLVHHYTAEASFLQKIVAVSSKKIPQARDIFDMYLLITIGTNTSPVLKMLDKSILSKAKNNIFSINYDVFKSQVISYLSPDDRRIYDSENVWDTIRLKIIEVIEGGDKK